ncbi:MAG: hypothetical protein JNN01_19385 [Opitutaceae bacterium]|nr:hypothetical protein [Opitutaceae bacterium]
MITTHLDRPAALTAALPTPRPIPGGPHREASLPFLEAALFFSGTHDLLVLNQHPDLTAGHYDTEELGAYFIDLP